MRQTARARAGIVLLALYRALAVLASLLFVMALIRLIDRFPAGESRASAMAGDPGAESDSPEPYMTFDLFWELPAEGPNASQASPAGLKNGTGLGNISWPLMEQSELMTLLKETLPVVESELVDKEAPQEGLQAAPVPEGSSEALQPTGVVKRFGSTEDTRTDPISVEGMANTGTADVNVTWRIPLKAHILISVLYLLIVLLIVLLIFKGPPWAEYIKKRFTALRANSELLYTEKGHKDSVV